MIIYNVTVKIDHSVHDEWLEWMRETHVPDVMATGLFADNKICRLLEQDDTEGFTYTFQYFCNTMDDFETYQEKHAERLQQDHLNKFKDKYVAFRTLMEEV